MAEFYSFHESAGKSELLSIAVNESLLLKSSFCECGNCHKMVKIIPDQRLCPTTNCDTEWKQIISYFGSSTLEEPWLPIYVSNVVRELQKVYPDYDPIYETHHGRPVQTAEPRKDFY